MYLPSSIFLKEKFSRKTLKRIAYFFLRWAENINNCNPETNGENYFLNNILFEKDHFVVLDVGANLGEYATSILNSLESNSGEIHLFEPSPYCMDLLNKKFHATSNVYLNECACSDSEGVVKLYFDKPGSELASLYQRDLKEYAIDLSLSLDVKTITLEKYISECSLGHVDLIKIDVEGHEKAVLIGMGKYLTPDYVSCIQFEYGGCNLDSMVSLRDIYRTLENAGYRVCKIMPKGLLPLSYNPLMDNFQYTNYVAVPINWLP